VAGRDEAVVVVVERGHSPNTMFFCLPMWWSSPRVFLLLLMETFPQAFVIRHDLDFSPELIRIVRLLTGISLCTIP
jgi:hypothetical protein